MKSSRIALGLFISLLAGAGSNSFIASSQTARTGKDEREVRALWVVRTSLTSPDAIKQMVKRAVDGGFNTLIVQVRGRGDAYYHSRWEPRAETLAQQDSSFDPLELVINQAHEAGLRFTLGSTRRSWQIWMSFPEFKSIRCTSIPSG